MAVTRQCSAPHGHWASATVARSVSADVVEGRRGVGDLDLGGNWVCAFELVAKSRHVGQGQGGWREDQQNDGNAAGI